MHWFMACTRRAALYPTLRCPHLHLAAQSVVMQFKLVRGKYERDHARLEVQHTGRYLVSMGAEGEARKNVVCARVCIPVVDNAVLPSGNEGAVPDDVGEGVRSREGLCAQAGGRAGCVCARVPGWQ